MFIVIIFIIILTGCSNQEYDSAMENGKTAIDNEEYEKALSFFEQALEEKPDDQVAKTFFDQTRNTIAAAKLFNDGNFDEAIQALNEVLEHDDGSAVLLERAKKQLTEIKEIKIAYNDLDKLLKDVKELGDKKEYDQALSLINKALDNNFNHNSLDPLKQNLTKQQTDFKAAKKEMAKQDEQNKKQELINEVTGYWAYAENDHELCQFKEDYFVCAVMESDFYYYGRITSWDVDLKNEALMINIKDGSPINVSVSNSNKLTLGAEVYDRLSTEELENKLANFYDGTSEEFFDIEQLEEWDSQI